MKKRNQTKQDKVMTLKLKPAKQRQRGVIYLRPNHWTDHLPDQEKLCRYFSEKNNIDVIDTYKYLGDDVAEPAEFKSWGIAPILEYCQSHKGEIEVLIVASRDRLGTNTAEYLKCKVDLMKENVEILSATDIESVDSSMEEIRAMLAEYEQDKKKKI